MVAPLKSLRPKARPKPKAPDKPSGTTNPYIEDYRKKGLIKSSKDNMKDKGYAPKVLEGSTRGLKPLGE